jgi:hypothetical protein
MNQKIVSLESCQVISGECFGRKVAKIIGYDCVGMGIDRQCHDVTIVGIENTLNAIDQA